MIFDFDGSEVYYGETTIYLDFPAIDTEFVTEFVVDHIEIGDDETIGEEIIGMILAGYAYANHEERPMKIRVCFERPLKQDDVKMKSAMQLFRSPWYLDEIIIEWAEEVE